MLNFPKGITCRIDEPMILDLSGEHGLGKLGDDQNLLHQNSEAYLTFCNGVERYVGDILGRVFRPKDESLAAIFRDWVAHSSHLGFKAKFDILTAVVKGSNDLPEVHNQKQLEEDFRRMLKFRNALTHGNLVYHQSSDSFWVHHFRGRPEEDELTEERWQKLEASALRLHKALQDFSVYWSAKGKSADAEQDDADQPATDPESKPEGEEKPKPEAKGRSQ